MNQEECLVLLEQIYWQGQPTCPYCKSTKHSKYKEKRRYHCQECFTSYSVTVGTIFHKTHLALPQWFAAISLLSGEAAPEINIRQLAKVIGVSNNTAMRIKKQIRTINR